jgi:hypothetical protein
MALGPGAAQLGSTVGRSGSWALDKSAGRCAPAGLAPDVAADTSTDPEGTESTERNLVLSTHGPWSPVMGRGRLEQVLRRYVEHYDRHRPHRALGLEPPGPSAGADPNRRGSASPSAPMRPPSWPASRVPASCMNAFAHPTGLGRVSGPLADRGQGSRAGRHRGHRDGRHRAQRMPSATPVPGVGDLAEVVEQVTCGCQKVGRGC